MHLSKKRSSLVNIRTLTFVLLALTICMCSAQQAELSQEEIQEITKDIEPQTYCSKRLTMMMKVVCNYQQYFSQSHPVKKSMDNDLEFSNFDVDRIGADNLEASDYWGVDYSVVPYRGQRRVRGIIEECCRKPCFKRQLLPYCHRNG